MINDTFYYDYISNRQNIYKHYFDKLKSLEISKNTKRQIDNRLRSFNSQNSKDEDYSLSILIASNIDCSIKDIYSIHYLHKLTTDFYNQQFILQHQNIIVPENIRIKIFRIKKKILSLTLVNNDYLLAYLKLINYNSFSNAQLKLYIEAITYLRTSKPFNTKNSTITSTFKSTINNNNICKYEKKFLTRFSEQYSISRNVVQRYLINFNNKDCFSIDDLSYIISNISKTLNIKYSSEQFFSDLTLIKKLK